MATGCQRGLFQYCRLRTQHPLRTAHPNRKGISREPSCLHRLPLREQSRLQLNVNGHAMGAFKNSSWKCFRQHSGENLGFLVVFSRPTQLVVTLSGSYCMRNLPTESPRVSVMWYDPITSSFSNPLLGHFSISEDIRSRSSIRLASGELRNRSTSAPILPRTAVRFKYQSAD